MKKIILILMLLMVCFNISAQKAIVRRTNKVSHTQKTTRTNKSRINHSKTTPARKNKSVDFTQGQVVDLGLPSGTLWADRNLGAASITDEGGLFVWGDPYWENISRVPDGVNAISDTEYDMAQSILGYNWCMPTIAQFKELHDMCSINKTKKNGVEGYLVKGPNGKTLFFPFSSIYKTRFGNWDYQLSWTGEADSHGNPVTCNLILGLYSWNKTDRVTIRPVAVNYVDSCATDTVAFYGNY